MGGAKILEKNSSAGRDEKLIINFM